MFNSRNNIKLFAAFGLSLAVIFLGSCSKKIDPQQHSKLFAINSDYIPDSNFVAIEIARLIAERLPQDHFDGEEYPFMTGESREIENAFPLSTDENSIPSAYVFNYAGGEGYTIISADYRYEPILSFGKTGTLNEGDSIPAGMYEWMMHNLENIDLIREGKLYDTTKFQLANSTWAYTIDRMELKDCCIHPEVYTPAPYDPCNNWDNHINEVVGPLTQTRWGQGNSQFHLPNNDFNYLINSSISCSGKKPLAGCVPIAAAQILKYWSKPSPNFDYSAMYNLSASTQSQLLVAALCSTSQLDANYGCNETSALSAKVSPTLKNVYGFASGGDFILYTNAERWNIRNNILNNRIVYAGGNNKVTYKNFLIFKSAKYSEAHAWLIDGFRRNELGCYARFWFSMNWGYYGHFNNWCYESDWVPGNDRNFQYQRTIIKNIYP